jgi:hypothetical protein
LRAIVEPLGEDRLQQPSYASEWSIAQVLSHLGSGAEIFMMFLDAGLSGAGAAQPGRLPADLAGVERRVRRPRRPTRSRPTGRCHAARISRPG